MFFGRANVNVALLQSAIMKLLMAKKNSRNPYFDKDLDLYGENLTVLWLDKIREMIKFDSIEALIVQMKDDEEKHGNIK